MSKYMVSILDLQQIVSREDVPALLDKMGAHNICEIGVQYGGYLHILLTSNIKKIIAIDSWQHTELVSQNDSSYTQEQLDAQFNVVSDWAKIIPRIKVIRDFSVNASLKFENNYFDFVYIDADHTEKAVQEDIYAWWPKVRPGGILGGHDYSPAIVNINGSVLKFGVIEAVNKFANQNKLQLHIDKNMSWFIPKP